MRYLLVRSLLGTGDVSGAHAAAQVAVENAQEAALTSVMLADVLVRQGRLAEAEHQYKEAVRRDPGLARGHYGLGRMLLTQAQRVSALQAFDRARKLQPQDPEIALAVARLTPDVLSGLAILRSAVGQIDDSERAARLSAIIAVLDELKGKQPCRPLPGAAAVSLKLVEDKGQRWSLKVGAGGKRAVPMTLDTGADGLLLDPRAVKNAGIQFLAKGEISGLGDGKDLSSIDGLMPRIEFGGLVFVDCPVRVAKTMFQMNTRGLIGASVFKDFRLAFDFSDRTLTLERLEPLLGAEGKPALQDSTPGPEHAGWTPVRLWGSHIFIQVRVNGLRNAWFLIDTGAPFNMLDKNLAEQFVVLKRFTKLEIRGVSGKAREVYQSTGRVTLALAGLEQANEGMLAVDLSGTSADFGLEIGGIIGVEFLRHLDFRLDYRNGLALLAPRRAAH